MVNGSLEKLYLAERERLSSIAASDGEYLRPVFGAGACPARLMLVGEAPGAQETEAGQPFVGKAGRQLDELLCLAQIERSEIFITNTVKYRPTNGKKNRTPRMNEIEGGLPLLAREIAVCGAKVIATLGNVPLQALLLMHGHEKKMIGDMHGQAFALGHGRILFALYHPASVIYNPKLKPVLEEDIRALGELIRLT